MGFGERPHEHGKSARTFLERPLASLGFEKCLDLRESEHTKN